MFREMRRSRQQLSEKESMEILENGTAGVLALSGDEDYPYAVPISYVYCGSRLYFHSAVSGHKIDAVQKSNKASFCVISQDHIVPEEYTSYYKSVIAFGRIRLLTEESEKERLRNFWPRNTTPPTLPQDAAPPSARPGPAWPCWSSA